MKIELLREVLRIETKQPRRIDLKEERLASWRIEPEVHMLSDGNLFPWMNDVRRFGVLPHAPLGTLPEGSVISVLIGYDDERHRRIRSIGEVEFVAAHIERIDSRPFEWVLGFEERRTTLEHLIQIEGTEIENSVDGYVRSLAAHDPRHPVHASEPSFETVEGLVVDEVRLVEEEDVCKRDLLRAFVASAQLLLNVGCIDEGDDPVQARIQLEARRP